jgi:hypothetical protein
MNKKGATLTAWVFTIITILAFVLILQTQVLSPMNKVYNQSFNTGLNTSALDSFDQLRDSSDKELSGAEVSQTAQGLTLVSAWTVGRGMYQTIISFINGEFIYTLVVDILDMPPVVAQIIIMMIWISLILIIVYIFMKVVP